jgi:hypothetical protein
MHLWLICTLLLGLNALPVKAGEFRFPQRGNNLSKQDLQAVRELAPWLKHLKEAVEKDSNYPILMNKLHQQAVKYKFKPGKDKSLNNFETLWSSGSSKDDLLIKSLLGRAVSSTDVPENMILDSKGLVAVFENASKNPQRRGVEIYLANTFEE